MVLSLVLGEDAKVHRMARTTVIAAETASAVLMFPSDIVVGVDGDVFLRASVYTAHATYAVRVCVEILVGDEEAIEERTEHVCLQPGRTSSYHFRLFLALPNAFCNGWQSFQGLLHLGFRHVGRVNVKARQTHIRVRHVDREDCIQLSLQQLVEDGVCIADVISTGHNGPYILGCLDFLQMLLDILCNHFWDTPRIDRKNQSKRVRFVLEQSLEFVSNPLAVTRARKTICHIYCL